MDPLEAGHLIGIARRPRPRAPMELIDRVSIASGGGLDGDHKGLKFPRRGVTLLALEAWRAALDDLTDLAGPVPQPWTTRRANLLVEGIALPAVRGAMIRVGSVLLEVTAETYPCRRMEEANAGLLRALAKDARGGVTCRVLEGGHVRCGDVVDVLSCPTAHRPRLPG